MATKQIIVIYDFRYQFKNRCMFFSTLRNIREKYVQVLTYLRNTFYYQVTEKTIFILGKYQCKMSHLYQLDCRFDKILIILCQILYNLVILQYCNWQRPAVSPALFPIPYRHKKQPISLRIQRVNMPNSIEIGLVVLELIITKKNQQNNFF